jgi:RNA polymerase sigma-70 factor (ECF subfamily)
VLLGVYDTALPQVDGYLMGRRGRRRIAEELTSETFLAAADAVRRAPPPSDARRTPHAALRTIDVGWVIGVARHKLVDHWRRRAREERGLRAVASVELPAVQDPWDARLDGLRAAQTLDRLAPQHRLALTLRYLDDLPVAQVAALLGPGPHATEALLVRARTAFRADYTASDGEGDGRA